MPLVETLAAVDEEEPHPLEMKAKALQTCAVSGSDPLPEQTPNWHANSELLSFLAAL